MSKEKKSKEKKAKSRSTKTKKRISKLKKSKNAKKHLFGKVYAEWCGACQALEPKWEDMVNQLKGQKSNSFSEPEQNIKESIIVNKDGTVLEIIKIQDSEYDSYKSKYNDVLGNLEANGYPTIFRKKLHIPESPIEYYQGDRSPDNMIAWALDETRKEQQQQQEEKRQRQMFIGGSKRNRKYRHNTAKRNNCNSSFSQRISNFWGWK